MKTKKKTKIILWSLLPIVLIILLHVIGPIGNTVNLWRASGLVQFDSAFECGSYEKIELTLAEKTKMPDDSKNWLLEYTVYSLRDPVNPVDTALAANGRWFYFRMTGVKDKEIRLNFKNSDPVAPVYSYDGNSFERFTKEESQFRQISKQFPNDTVYVAYYIPYSFEYLQQRFLSWQETGRVNKLDTIGWSYQGRPIQMMTITDASKPADSKKRIYIHGRIHPSESPASWHLDSMIEQLVSDSPRGKAYREQAEFYIIPFVNPDGVANGMSRSNAQGVNMEINYDRPDSLTTIEVTALKKNLEELTANRPLDMILNMHSQSSPQVTYWIHTDTTTSAKFYSQQLLLANATISRSPVFHKNDLFFSDVAPRYVEGWTWNRFQEKTMAICFETPYTYYNDNPNGTWVDLENLYALGVDALNAIGDYYQWSAPDCFYLEPMPANRSEWEFLSPDDMVFMGKGFYVSKRQGAKMAYRLNNLPAGKYALYKWNPGFAEKVSADYTNEWVRIYEINQEKNAPFEWTVSAPGVGVRENLLMIERL